MKKGVSLRTILQIMTLTQPLHTDLITLILFGVHVVIQAAAACIMFAKHRQQNDRSRLFIALFFAASAVASVGEIIIALWAPQYSGGFLLLDPMIILCGFAVFFLLLLYPVEVLRPKWLNTRRIVVMLLPWLILSAALLIGEHFAVRPLHSLNDVATYIHEPNVWLRILLTFIYIPYGVWLLVMQHNWRNSSAPLPWIHAVVVITMCMTITYFGSRGLRLFWANVAHETLYTAVTVLILYIELAIRLRVPDDKADTIYTPPIVEPDAPIPATPDVPTPQEVSDVIKEVANRLTEAMQNPDVWQNPDLTQTDLIRLIGTNRRYCQLAIKYLGYDSYPDMINRRRVRYIQEQLHTAPHQNLQNLFYDAGYRSRTSAWRNFSAITGCSPTDFTQGQSGTDESQ